MVRRQRHCILQSLIVSYWIQTLYDFNYWGQMTHTIYGQTHIILAADQQLFKVLVDIQLVFPDRFSVHAECSACTFRSLHLEQLPSVRTSDNKHMSGNIFQKLHLALFTVIKLCWSRMMVSMLDKLTFNMWCVARFGTICTI